MSDGQKDTIYIDVDDEITSIIDKVRGANQRIVALVLPKRATMLQSSVNMKLLKKAADADRKQIVLITTESGLLPLAGTTGLYVAGNLQSKPEIPSVAESVEPADELLSVNEDETPKEFDAKTAGDKSVGELAGIPTEEAAAKAEKSSKAKPELTPRPIPRASDAAAEEEAIELDNDNAEEPAAPKSAAKKTKPPKDKKVPNFERFRLKLILAALLIIILVVGWILADIILPHATVDVATNTSGVNTSLTLNLSTTAKTLDPQNLTIPAQLQQTQKTQKQTVNTTGQKNEGQTATGNVSMSAQECGPGLPPSNVAAGTGITYNGLTYVTQQDVSFNYNGLSKTGCANFQGNNTNITAQNPGSQYNTGGSVSFNVPNDSGVTATGSASGGTDNIVQVVSQSDIDSATQKLAAPDTGSIKTTLANDLQAGGFYPLTATFNAGSPSNSSSANPGDQASTVTVTQSITYTMFGVPKSDLETVLDNAINSQIDTSKQTIQNDGLSGADFNVLSQSGTGAQVSLQDTATVGPKLNIASLKEQIAGKKPGDVKNIIGGLPGVTSVTVHYSPFWVSSTPKNTSKITIKLTKGS